MKKKIVTIKELKQIIDKLRNRKNIVHCHGVFDLLHIGHIKHFQKAKSFGDILIVSITSDENVNKAPGRPKFNDKLRSEAVASIQCVDYVVVSNDATPLKIINIIKPNFYCKGNDYKNNKLDITGNISKESRLVKKYGGKIIYTNEISFSSSNLINSYLSNYSKDQTKNLANIKKKYNFTKINNLINNFEKIKVLVIGELIIDEYVFSEAVGKSGKEPMLTLREMFSEKYLGGAAVVARHISTFCNKITLISMIGQNQEDNSFIKKNISKNVNVKLIKKNKSPTILKKRFIEHLSKNKILGVYKINDNPLEKQDEIKLQKLINQEIKKHDLVIVSDYGHGFLSKKCIKLILDKSKFLAVNSQINSFNIGLHGIRNYKNLDCVIINEKEMRYELRSRDGDIKKLTTQLCKEQKIKKLIVTRGTDGAIMYDNKIKTFFSSAAYSDKSLDKVGSGDAMLAIISLCLKQNLDQDLSLFISSIAGALAVASIGNKNHITKQQILRSLENLLK